MEIITVQLGSYANFVGSHFWNIQVTLMALPQALTCCLWPSAQRLTGDSPRRCVQDEALGCAEDPDWSTLAPTISSEVVCAWSEDRYVSVLVIHTRAACTSPAPSSSSTNTS